MRRFIFLASIAACACALLPLPAAAQEYPNEPIKLIASRWQDESQSAFAMRPPR